MTETQTKYAHLRHKKKIPKTLKLPLEQNRPSAVSVLLRYSLPRQRLIHGFISSQVAPGQSWLCVIFGVWRVQRSFFPRVLWQSIFVLEHINRRRKGTEIKIKVISCLMYQVYFRGNMGGLGAEGVLGSDWERRVLTRCDRLTLNMFFLITRLWA